MPELVIDFITSLDGYGAAEGWPGWWGLEGPEYLAWLADHPEPGCRQRRRRSTGRWWASGQGMTRLATSWIEA